MAARSARHQNGAFVDGRERETLEAFSTLALGCNPFLPERVEAERRALGARFQATSDVWHVDAARVGEGAALPGLNPNLPLLLEAAEALAGRLRDALLAGARASREDRIAYEGLIRYLLYARYEGEFFKLVLQAASGAVSTGRVAAYRRFAADVEHFLAVPGVEAAAPSAAPHLFAWGFQIRRAFQHTFREIHGGSMPAARLRAKVWESIFTHDANRYRRVLYDRMGDIPTLVTGESGTGKELVARAIGLSRYVAFDASREAFTAEYADSFHAVNPSALSPALIESELFGHRKGAFTGAVEDREGWLETCGAHGTVFVDEIGDLDPGIQVKLLRVLQSRSFQRIGETRPRAFSGKIIAATNRDLAAEMHAGRFREDFYYRLCADLIETPTLREQLADAPGELANLVLILARRVAGEEEGPALAAEVVAWVGEHLGPHYPWPGNVRELEQCVRNVLIRGEYRPARPAEGATDELAEQLREGRLPADALLRHYCTRVYALCGSYEEAARRLGLDRRTVKAKVDPVLLASLRS